MYTKIKYYIKDDTKWREHQIMELHNFSDEEIQKNIKEYKNIKNVKNRESTSL